ncbi:MAG: ATP-binding protein [Ruminococcus sp.]|nr:ATP-binding protein [Ruminococcus sp.]
MFEITSGKIQGAQKVVIYGPEGIGKSTFASQFPDPIFIDTEGSTKEMDVRRLPKPTSWEMLKNEITEVARTKPCKTLVIDTIDWAEQLCIISICNIHKKSGIEDFGYGNGYVYEKEEFGRFLNLLGEVVDAGINVVLTAHAQMRKFEQPDELGAYDRWELKLGKKTSSQTAPLVKEWADMVLFANYKTYAVQVDEKGKKFKAQGGERRMYTAHHTCWDAKNRQGLEPELPFEYSTIAHVFETGTYSKTTAAKPDKDNPVVRKSYSQPEEVSEAYEDTPAKAELNVPEDLPKALKDLMRANNVDESDIRLAVSMKGHFTFDTPMTNYPPDYIDGVLIGAWDQVYAMIKENQKVPF